MQNFERLMSVLTPKIIPVIAMENVDDAVPLAEALVDAGLNVLEVTFRTAAAANVMRAMKTVHGAVIGAGTVSKLEQMETAQDLGCQFMVSPGSPLYILDMAKDFSGIDLLPGTATATDIMTAVHYDHRLLKFFPAERSGGAKAIKDFGGPFSQVKFCATGGITADNVAEYFKLPNLQNVGATWVCPADAIRDKKWEHINLLAKTAVAAATGVAGGPP